MEGLSPYSSERIASNGLIQWGNDDALHFEWKNGSMECSAKSEIEGRKIFMDVAECWIHYPGLKNILVKQFKPGAHQALATFFKQHPKAEHVYRQWKAGAAQQIQGTPISEWPTLTESERAELRAMNIFSIEQVAASSDSVCQSMGPKGREWRSKAQAFLATAKETAAAQKYAAENERMKDELADLRKQIERLAIQQVREDEEVAPRKRGKTAKQLQEYFPEETENETSR